MQSNPWFPSNSQSDDSTLTQIVCFPHAGGGSAHYHRWEKLLPDRFQVLPIKLPGREARFNDPAFDNLPDLISSMSESLQDRLREPFCLFGHSMGALIAYETAIRLRTAGLHPTTLFVSACRSPDRFAQDAVLHKLPDDEMISKLVGEYGSGDESPEELQMMAIMANTIRADLKLLETYEHQPTEPLDCPIIGLCGTDDKKVSSAAVNGWRAFTSARFTLRTFPGHHFFLRDQEAAVTQLVTNKS